MNLSKMFDSNLHDVRIVRSYACAFDEKASTFLYSHLKRSNENVKVNDIFSSSKTLFPTILQGSLDYLVTLLTTCYNDLVTTLQL